MSDKAAKLISLSGDTLEDITAAFDSAVASSRSAQAATLKPEQYRFAALATSPEELQEAWNAWRKNPVQIEKQPRQLVYVYSGQGSQYPQMGKILFQTSSQFHQDVTELLSMSPNGGGDGRSLFDILMSEGQTINEINYTSPILFAFEVALTRMWQRWGVTPDAVVGHSFGEFPAALCAGAIAPRDGMALVSERGRLMNEYRLNAGTESLYCVLKADIGDVVELLEAYGGRVAVAGVNAPEIATISGSKDDIESVVATLEQRGVKSKVLPVLVPAHSHLLSGTAERFSEICRNFAFRQPEIDWYSTLTGNNLRGAPPVDGEYWRRHMVEPVRFWASMVQATDRGPSIFLEIGPGETLTSMAAAAVERDQHKWFTSLSAKGGGINHLMNSAINLWMAGVNVDLDLAMSELSGPTAPG